MNTTIKIRTRLASLVAAGVLALGLPLAVNAQSSNTGQTQSQDHANPNANLGVNAPLPEPATWIGMGTLAGAAVLLVLAHRRRKTT